MHKPDMIEVVNLSTRISADDAGLMTRVAAFQLMKHASLKWGMVPIPVRLVDKPTGGKLIAIMDDSDQADALGYHGEDKLDRPVGRVFASPVLDSNGSGAVLWDKDRTLTTVSAVLSHEVLEMYIDPSVNYWADGPEIPEGSEYALEVCDPVQADYYDMPTADRNNPAVRVSNFVLPAWFDEGEEGPYDYMRHLSRGHSILPGGYMIVRKGVGDEQVVFGSELDLARFLSGQKSLLARTFQRDESRAEKMITRWTTDKRVKHMAELEPIAGPPTREDIRKEAEKAGTVFALPREYKTETVLAEDAPKPPPVRQPDPKTIAPKQKAPKPVPTAPMEKATDAAKERKAKADKDTNDKKRS